MPKRALTDVEYDALLAAYRERPGMHRNAGRAAGVGHEAARRAWLYGWPRRNRAPIKAVIAHEAELARQIADREQMHQKIIQKAGEESAVLNAAKDKLTVRALKGSLYALVQTCAALVQHVQRFNARASECDPSTVSLNDAERSRDRALRSLEKIAVVAEKVFQTDRLVAGRPTSIVGIANEKDVMPATIEEAENILDAAKWALERMRLNGQSLEGDGLPTVPVLPPGQRN